MRVQEQTHRKLGAFNGLNNIQPEQFFGSGVTISIRDLSGELEIIQPVVINGEDFPEVHAALKEALRKGLETRKKILEGNLREIEKALN